MKRQWLLLEIAIGFVLAYYLITTSFSGDRKFEELALGTETVTYNAVDERGKPIHIQRSNAEEGNVLMSVWRERGSKPVILFFGNSQTHSINQQKAGEVNFIELLYRNRLDKRDDIICISLPNAGLQEFYLVYQYWKRLLPIKAVVLPIFMDDLREDGIRDIFFTELVKIKFQLADTSEQIVRKINQELQSYWPANSNDKSLAGSNLTVLDETLQEKSEKYLNQRLDEKSTAWMNRPNVRGDFFNWLYRLRNTVFRIKASTIRKMIPQRYELNMQALKLLVEDCVSERKKSILYIPPIRSDATLPYDENDYNNFKKQVKELSEKMGPLVYFRNYEGIVPAELWGYKAATNLQSDREIDYMHFQYRGHQIMADSLQLILNQAIYSHGF